MPLFAKVNLGIPKQLSLENYEPSLSRQISNAWDVSARYNPTEGAGRVWDMGDAITGFGAVDYDNDADLVEFASERKENPFAKMPMAEQERVLKENGLSGTMKPDPAWTPEAFNFVVENRKIENAQAVVSDKTSFAVSLLPSLAAGMTDPLNILSAFTPGMPAARVTQMLQANAKSMAGRLGVYAAEGAVGGAIGAAAVEPVVYASQSLIGSDYTFANSLMNIGFGSVMGAGMKGIGGRLSEWRINRHNQNLQPGEMPIPQRWEYAQATEFTEAQRLDFANRQYDALLETDQGRASPEAARISADDSSRIYDAWLRNLAWKLERNVDQIYRDWTVDFSGPEPRLTRLSPEERAALKANLDEWGGVDSFFDNIEAVFAREDSQIRAALEKAREEWGAGDKFFDNIEAALTGRKPETRPQAPEPARPAIDPLWDRDQAEVARLRAEGLPDDVIAEALPVIDPLWDRDPELVRLYRERGLPDDVIAESLPVIKQPGSEPVRIDGGNLYQAAADQLAGNPNRARVSFPSYHRAIITFFKSADLTSAPHEIYHIIRRQLEEYATGPDAPSELRSAWAAACDFVGAKPGEKWTVVRPFPLSHCV